MTKVTIKLGNLSRRPGTLAPDVEEGLEQLMDSLGSTFQRRAIDNISVNAASIKRDIAPRVGKSLELAVRFAANNLVGVKSARQADSSGNAPSTNIYIDWADNTLPQVNPNQEFLDTMTMPGKIAWKALSPATLRKKAEGKGKGRQEQARQFFVDSGNLRGKLLELSKKIVQHTGDLQVEFKKEGSQKYSQYRGRSKKLKVGQLRLVFVPKLRIANLPGAHTANIADVDTQMVFEKSLGLDSDTVRKLRGAMTHNGYLINRPLLQPVFTYWILNRIPRLTSAALTKALKVQTFNGVESYGLGTK